MFATIAMSAQTMNTLPDTCNVPSPVGPVPTPFPNMVAHAMNTPSVINITISAGMAENLMAEASLSNGDEAGVAGGLVSGMIMGPCMWTVGAVKVMFGTAPALMMGSLSAQNGKPPNAIGAVTLAGQCKFSVT